MHSFKTYLPMFNALFVPPHVPRPPQNVLLHPPSSFYTFPSGRLAFLLARTSVVIHKSQTGWLAGVDDVGVWRLEAVQNTERQNTEDRPHFPTCAAATVLVSLARYSLYMYNRILGLRILKMWTSGHFQTLYFQILSFF